MRWSNAISRLAVLVAVLLLLQGCGGGGGGGFPVSGPSTLQINSTSPNAIDVALDDPMNVIGAVPANASAAFTVTGGIHTVYITEMGGTTTYSGFYCPPLGTSILDWP